MIKKFTIAILLLTTVLNACKTIDEDMITPDWIQEKIKYLSADCYYKGTEINRTLFHTSKTDSAYYYEFLIPANYFPSNEIYTEQGENIAWSDTLSYNEYLAERIINKKIWTFPTGKCN